MIRYYSIPVIVLIFFKNLQQNMSCMAYVLWVIFEKGYLMNLDHNTSELSSIKFFFIDKIYISFIIFISELLRTVFIHVTLVLYIDKGI